MARKKGICTLCGRGGKLTFEHVPPQAAANWKGAVMMDMHQFAVFSADLPADGMPQPDGTGVAGLCDSCNNRGSREYVPAFVELSRQMQQFVYVELVPWSRFAEAEKLLVADVTLKKIRRLRIAKQIVSMLLTTAGPKWSMQHPHLRTFVLDRAARGLPTDCHLGLNLVLGGTSRISGPQTYEFPDGVRGTVLDVSYPPHQFTLTVGPPRSPRHSNITHWADVDDTEHGEDARLSMRIGFVLSAVPTELLTHRMLREGRVASYTVVEERDT